MLGQEYELLPRPLPLEELAGTSAADSAWSCRTVVSPAAAAAAAAGRSEDALETAIEIPLRESSGLLWMWPDPSPEGETPV